MTRDNIVILGNSALLNLSKTAYFCSNHFHPRAVFPSYDWAKRMQDEKCCVISGFQSRIEMDVLGILLRGVSPIILVLARSIYTKIPIQYRPAIDKGNMLIISPFPEGIYRVDSKTCYKRNCWIMQNADKVVIGSMTPGGMLEKIVQKTGIIPVFLKNN